MNRKIALALALAAAGTAYADDITIDPVPFTSTLTRAEVIADMMQFRASRVDPWAQEYDPLAHFQGMRSREQVNAEVISERNRIAAFHGEDSGSVYLARRELPQSQQPTQVAAAEGEEEQH